MTLCLVRCNILALFISQVAWLAGLVPLIWQEVLHILTIVWRLIVPILNKPQQC